MWVSVLFGLSCISVGAAVGISWPRAAAPMWTEAPPLRQPGVLPSFADVVQQIGPGVVTVRALRASAAKDSTVAAVSEASGLRAVHASGPGLRSGSGFVVRQEGLVVTSRHIVVDAIDIEVIVPQRGAFRAEVVGEDAATDVALLRLEGAPTDLLALPLGDGADLRAGDWIVAVGNPFGYAQTVTAGLVSFVGRHLSHTDLGVTNDFLQISAPVNPGSSGCPVLDLQGRVVGVTTQAPADAQGISFAVPSRTLKWSLEAMQKQPDGRVRRGYLGIEFSSHSTAGGSSERNAPNTPNDGALIVHVVEGQPAHRAGVRAGDVVLRVDGARIHDARALHECIVCTQPGTSISLQLLRDGLIEDSVVAVLSEVGARRTEQAN